MILNMVHTKKHDFAELDLNCMIVISYRIEILILLKKEIVLKSHQPAYKRWVRG